MRFTRRMYVAVVLAAAIAGAALHAQETRSSTLLTTEHYLDWERVSDAQIQDARNWGNEGCRTESPDLNFGSTFNGGCSNTGIGAVSSSNKFGTGLDLHQGYILVKNVGVQGLSLKIGRQEIFFGDHRLFGNFNWSNIGNSFDAVRLTHSMPIADVDVFWARFLLPQQTAVEPRVVALGAEQAARKLETIRLYGTQWAGLDAVGKLSDPGIHGFEVYWELPSPA